jgi:hypothetical protein
VLEDARLLAIQLNATDAINNAPRYVAQILADGSRYIDRLVVDVAADRDRIRYPGSVATLTCPECLDQRTKQHLTTAAGLCAQP